MYVRTCICLFCWLAMTPIIHPKYHISWKIFQSLSFTLAKDEEDKVMRFFVFFLSLIICLQNRWSALVDYRGPKYLVQGKLDALSSARSSTVSGKTISLICHFHRVFFLTRKQMNFYDFFPLVIVSAGFFLSCHQNCFFICETLMVSRSFPIVFIAKQ